MKRKIFLMLLSYFTLGMVAFTVESCVDMSYDATICDVTFTGINSVYTEEPDSFVNEIGFDIRALTSSPTCYLKDFSFFNAAYATTKCAVFQNQLVQSSYKLSLDRLILLNQDTLLPGTDLLSVQGIRSLTDIQINEECQVVISKILFKKELTDQMTFETGEYTVTFQCSTNDHKTFIKTRKVIFEK